MPFVKYKPFEQADTCTHSGHNPPGHIVLEEGEHTYECPACHKQTVIVIRKPRLEAMMSVRGAGRSKYPDCLFWMN